LPNVQKEDRLSAIWPAFCPGYIGLTFSVA
jgi:hypothetical protein